MTGRRSWALLAVAVACGCGTRPGQRPEPVPPPSWAAARVQCGRVLGSGCLLLSAPRYGSYVLTAAHLLEEPERALVALYPVGGSAVWHSARVLKIDRRADLALLWRPDAVFERPLRPAWSPREPAPGDPADLLVAAPGSEPQTVRARVKGPGEVHADRPLEAGMSGSGLFSRGELAGLLYGHRAGGTGADHDGRYVRPEAMRRFLEPRFGFLATGGRPVEPR